MRFPHASLLACGLLALAACGSEQQAQTPPPPEVGVIEAAPRTVPLTRDLVGRLTPYRSADVRARVAGVLQRRTYQEGSDVTEGQVLFEIDPAQLQATLGVARGQLAQAEASYANARATADRARRLAPEKFVSQSDLDNAIAAERSAAAAVESARAGVQTAQINLGFARVVAPIAGRAGKQQVTEGALVGQGDATLLTTVDQIDRLYANFSINSAELSQLRTAANVSLAGAGNTPVEVVLGGGQVHAEPGMLDFADATVDPATGAVAMRALVPNPGKELFPGSFVTLRVKLGELRDAYLVPQEAVQRDANGAFVRLVGTSGKVERRNITTGAVQDGQWIVTAGLAGGDKVIVSGLQKVQDGAPATATPWQPAGDPPGQAATPPQAEPGTGAPGPTE